MLTWFLLQSDFSLTIAFAFLSLANLFPFCCVFIYFIFSSVSFLFTISVFLKLYFSLNLNLDSWLSFSFLNCIYWVQKRKTITTTKFKRQSSSVGWKLKKIICYVGKYKGIFFYSVCAWVWERYLIRFRNLSYFHITFNDIHHKLWVKLLPGRFLSFVNQQDYQILNICLKKRKLFTSLFTSMKQVKSNCTSSIPALCDLQKIGLYVFGAN